MNFKKDLKALLWLLIILILIVIFVPLSSVYKQSMLNTSQKELNALETKINNYDEIYVKGYNLNLNSNFAKTSLAIDNSLNLTTDEYKYVSFEGYLFANKNESIKIKLNVNGYTDSMTKNVEYLINDNSEIANYNIDKIIEMNNKYFAITKYGVFIADDGINFKKTLSKYEMIDAYKDEKSQRIYFITSENKLMYYSFSTNQFSIYEWSHKVNSVCVIDDNLYIASDNGLYAVNTLDNFSKKISDQVFIKLNNYLNNLYLISNDKKLYKFTDNNFIKIYDQVITSSLQFSLTGSLYFISNNILYNYLPMENKVEKINISPFIDPSTIINEIYMGINNHLYLSTNVGVYDYKYEGNITQIKDMYFDNVLVFQSKDQTLYFYSQTNFKGIKFYQDFN